MDLLVKGIPRLPVASDGNTTLVFVLPEDEALGSEDLMDILILQNAILFRSRESKVPLFGVPLESQMDIETSSRFFLARGSDSPEVIRELKIGRIEKLGVA